MLSQKCGSAVFTGLFVVSGLVLSAGPLCLWIYFDDFKGKLQPHTIAWLVASVFVALTLPISIWEIVMHLRYMHQPMLQVPIIRVLWMVPIYAVDSWLALRISLTEWKDVSIYINTARECYEAFVVYNFLVFLARYVALTAPERRTSNLSHSASKRRGGDSSQSVSTIATENGHEAEGGIGNAVLSPRHADGGAAIDAVPEVGIFMSPTQSFDAGEMKTWKEVNAKLCEVLGRKREIKHLFPLCWLQPWKMKSTAHHQNCEFYANIKFGVTQYIVVKLVCALVAFVLKPLALWAEGSGDPAKGYFWATFVTNFSQCWALYCLVLFYMGLKKELHPLNPVGKFVAVKAVVFFSFWQSIIVALLVNWHIITDAEIFPETTDKLFLIAATQDFLICIEMFVFSIYHHKVFSYRQFIEDKEEEGPQAHETSLTTSLKAMMDLEEVWKDTRGSLQPILPRKPYPIFKLPPVKGPNHGCDVERASNSNGAQTRRGSSGSSGSNTAAAAAGAGDAGVHGHCNGSNNILDSAGGSISTAASTKQQRDSSGGSAKGGQGGMKGAKGSLKEPLLDDYDIEEVD